MADEKTPVNWYAVVTTGSDPIQPYLDRFELLTEPKLSPLEQLCITQMQFVHLPALSITGRRRWSAR
jgi:hypothetical protein